MSQRDPLKHPTRWLAALGATLALTVATAPVATAAPTVPASLAASSSASVAQSDTAADRFGIDSSPAHAAVDRAINPDDYECGPTDFDVYIDGVIDSLSLVELIFLVNHLEMLDIPTYDALLFGTTADARYNLRLRLPPVADQDVRRRPALLGHRVRRHPAHLDARQRAR